MELWGVKNGFKVLLSSTLVKINVSSWPRWLKKVYCLIFAFDIFFVLPLVKYLQKMQSFNALIIINFLKYLNINLNIKIFRLDMTVVFTHSIVINIY